MNCTCTCSRQNVPAAIIPALTWKPAHDVILNYAGEGLLNKNILMLKSPIIFIFLISKLFLHINFETLIKDTTLTDNNNKTFRTL